MRNFDRARRRRFIWCQLVFLLLAACAPPVSVPDQPITGTAAPAIVAPTQPIRHDHAPAVCQRRGPFPPLLPELEYGANAFLFGTDQERVMQLMRSAGLGWLRQQIHWRDIETQPGKYDWRVLDAAVEAAQRHSTKVLLSVVRSPAWATKTGTSGLPDDPATLGSFMHVLARRYAGRVSAYEIWNEPNLAIENGGRASDPAHYLAVLQAAYAAVRAGDPCALVLAAPLAATATNDPSVAVDDLQFYRALYALDDGAFLRAADAIALHPGGGARRFDERWPDDEPTSSRSYFRHIEEIRALMEQAGDPRQAWITEVGWAVEAAPGAPPPVDAQEQAHNVIGALRFTRQHYPWVAAIFVWNLNFAVLGAPDDEKSVFGILNPDWSPRPAYLELQGYLNAVTADKRRRMPQLSNTAPYQPAWQLAVDGKIHTPATLGVDGTIYVASDPGHLYAVAPLGGLRWRFDAPGETRHPPAHGADGSIYLGDRSGHLTALRPDGTTRWQINLGAAIRGTPQLANDALYVVLADGGVIRLDLDGNLVWRAELGIGLGPGLLAAAGSAQAPQLYVPTEQGDLLALSVDGTIQWRTTIGQRMVSAPALAEQPAGAGSTLLVGDAEGYLSSVNAETGELRWQLKLLERRPSPTLSAGGALITAPPLVGADGTIYLGGRDGGLSAVGPEGNLRWRYDTHSDISASPTQAPDGTIYTGLYDKRLLAFEPTGKLRWEGHMRGPVRSTPLLAPDGTLYVGTVGGVLHALAPQHKRDILQDPTPDVQ